jgi:aspartate ammonia-lyase
MNRYSQLTHLILDFYREDLAELQQIKGLQAAKVSRRWGVLRINCAKPQIATALIEAIDILREPIAQLRLAHTINILVNGNLLVALPVGSRKLVS